MDNSELRIKLEYLESDLDTMDETISTVKNNPSQFQISRIELNKRTDFINTTRQQLSKLKQTLQNTNNNKTYDSIKTQESRLDSELQEQQQIIDQQDQNLEQFSKTVSNVKQIGLTMGDELEHQQT